MKTICLLLFLCSALTLPAEESPSETTQAAILFTPPEGWRFADAKELPKYVKVMVVGKGLHECPPSINLGMEPFKGTLKDYLKIVKRINEAKPCEWKDLGTIQTQAGKGSLSQLDMRTEWGSMRMMHVILVANGYAYILTTAALRDEFPLYYEDFFKTMRSLRFDHVSPDQLTNNDHL